ncbi:hypothetical protein LXA47_00430 [Massilia sp. P8910]|uniref:hypothetical protein n=1 Tax=Massilia antarctica TaxID=2765360 RepID=UPI001E4C02F5|nr:hypothetical protein [Massilia antarctica]MCE3602077.1 hypothetical protein [Massilia antarctica]
MIRFRARRAATSIAGSAPGALQRAMARSAAGHGAQAKALIAPRSSASGLAWMCAANASSRAGSPSRMAA